MIMSMTIQYDLCLQLSKRLMIAVCCYIVHNMLTYCIMKNNKEYSVSTILIGWFMMLNATFNNISIISWRSVLLVEETGCAILIVYNILVITLICKC